VDDAIYDGGVGYDDGPRSTPTVDDDSVYVLSSYLNLYRLNATNGSIIWQQDLRFLYAGSIIAWENAASPLLEQGLLFLNANCGSSTLFAIRASDGYLMWSSQNEALTHSTPVLAAIHGVPQVIFATQSGLVSLDPQSGDLFWKFNYPFAYSTSLGVSPVVYQDLVFICGAHSYGMGSVTIQASLTNGAWTTTRLWSTNNPAAHWMTPIVYQGFLYGQFGIQQFDTANAQLKCIDILTGAVRWSTNGFGRCATLLVDNHLLILTEVGDLVLAKPDPNAYTEISRFRAIPDYYADTNKCWNSPAVADGRVYVRSTFFGACFDLSMPNLKLDPPQPVPPNRFQLTIRTANGTPVNSNRLAAMEVRASTNLALAPSTWSPLTNSLLLTNGLVRINNVDAGAAPRRFFIVSEPK